MTSSAPAAAPTIVCFGETLIDLLPTGKRIGGAPLNVAYHAQRLGATSAIISRVGSDELGNDILAFLQNNNLDGIALPIDEGLSTGTVGVTFSNRETPQYEIHSPVAWDCIDVSEAAKTAVSAAHALVFGSLAARSAHNMNSLHTLLLIARVRVLDVNLRVPFFTEEKIRELLSLTDIVKVNDEEIRLIGSWYGWSGGEKDLVRQLFQTLNLQAVVLTRGSKGAAMMDKSGYYEHPGISVEVVDSIGAGDAFLAAFLTKYLSKDKPGNCLSYACAVGAYVATQTGGTPEYDPEDITDILRQSQQSSEEPTI